MVAPAPVMFAPVVSPLVVSTLDARGAEGAASAVSTLAARGPGFAFIKNLVNRGFEYKVVKINGSSQRAFIGIGLKNQIGGEEDPE